MGNELQPINDAVSAEARALAEHLRDLFRPLGISVRRYATRCHSDPGTVSRYLNGTRIPPWPFVRNLLAEVGSSQQQPLQRGVVDHTKALHRAALRVSNRSLYTVQTLQDQLEQADREQRQAGLREQALLEALQARQHRIADLEVSMRELEGAGAAQLSAEREVVRKLERSTESAQDEVERLREEVEMLQQQLAVARDLVVVAEDRCVALESQLEAAEASAETGNDSRESDALNIALQDAADAISRAEELQQEVNRLRDTETLRRTARRTPQPKPEEIQLPVNELVPLLVKEAALEDGPGSQKLRRLVAQHRSAADVGAILKELKEKQHDSDITGMISVTFAQTRTPREVFELVSHLGWGFLTADGVDLPDSILTWFAWEANTSKAEELLELVEAIPSDEPARVIIQAIAERKGPVELRELIEASEASRKVDIIIAAARRRDVNKIPGLLSEFLDAKYPHYPEMLVDEFIISRPYSIDQLLTVLDVLHARSEKDYVQSRISELNP
ncbi:hypothetical protein ACIO1C_03870 [Streptomyces sp. NPDC087420]|uniref:hypothetical protein n=1 Tax=Streptomyces sp. NPDC087420 TaxID=3365785 RepID=UPI003839838C